MSTTDSTTNRRLRLWLGIALAMAVIVRLYALQTSMWYDEILSLQHALQANSLLDILFWKHENNHLLATLWMYLLGDQASWNLYRLPALLCGIGAVYTAAAILFREQKTAGLIAAGIFGTSYMMTLHSTEARGYGPAVLFGLLAYRLIKEHSADQNPRLRYGFWLVCLLGLASHQTFMIEIIGLLLWMLIDRRHPRQILLWFTVPVVAGAICIGAALLSGGYSQGVSLYYPTIWSCLLRLATAPLGFPPTTVHAMAGLTFMGWIVDSSLRLLWQQRKLGEFWFMVFMFSAAVLLPVIIYRWHPWSVRFSILSIAFFYIVLARQAANLIRHTATRWLGLAVVAGFISWNLIQSLLIPTYDRSEHPEAFAYIDQQTGNAAAVVSSSCDCTGEELWWYRKYIAPQSQLTYRSLKDPDVLSASWYLYAEAHSHMYLPGSYGKDIPPEFQSSNRRHILQLVEPHFGDSGATVHLYNIETTNQ